MNAQKALLRFDKTIYMVNPLDVIFMEAEGAYTKIKFKKGKEVRISRNLKGVIELFHNYPYFFRIHRSTVVNLHDVEKIASTDNFNSSKVFLTDGTVLQLANAHRKNFFKTYNELFGLKNTGII